MLYVDNEVTREYLATLPEPVPNSAWHNPDHHYRFVKTLDKVLQEHGLKIESERFSMPDVKDREAPPEEILRQRSQGKLFGVMELSAPEGLGLDQVEGMTISLGMRTSNDTTLSRGVIAGGQVTVCSNGLYSGDAVLLQQRHSHGNPLADGLYDAVQTFFGKQRSLEERILRAQEKILSATEAKALLWDAFNRHKILPKKFMGRVYDTFFHPEETWDDGAPECQGDDLFSLHNSFTRPMRELPMRQRIEKSQRLDSLLVTA